MVKMLLVWAGWLICQSAMCQIGGGSGGGSIGISVYDYTITLDDVVKVYQIQTTATASREQPHVTLVSVVNSGEMIELSRQLFVAGNLVYAED